MSPPINPPTYSGPRNGDLPAYVSNGMIGLRVRENPLMAGMTIVSGMAGEHPQKRIEAAMPVPYPLAGGLEVNGVRMADQPWAVSDLTQAYDFASGELTSSFAFKVGEARVEVEILTFASRGSASLVLQEVAIRADHACDIVLQAIVDTRELRGSVARRRTSTPGEDEAACDGSLLWDVDGGLTRCGIA